MMSFLCCFLLGPILYFFVKDANSLCSSYLLVFSGDQISNGFRQIYLAFVFFRTLLQLVPSGYISAWSLNCTTFNFNYGTEYEINVHITNTELFTGSIHELFIILSIFCFEKVSTFYPGSLHAFKAIKLLVICQTLDELVNYSFDTTVSNNSVTYGLSDRSFSMASHRSI